MQFISYAQNFEDVMLRRALASVSRGFYIDVGAAHPVEMSVTKAFYDIGWRGINLEPAPHYFDLLLAGRPADVNLQVAAAERCGTELFHEILETGLSTLDPDIAAGHAEAGWIVQSRQVELVTLAEICRQYALGEIHFLKIDVEGAEGAVLAGADFHTFRPWIVLLEATRPLTSITAHDWESLIVQADYIFVWFDGLNRFYVAREHLADLQEHFKLPPNAFDNFSVYSGEISSQLADAKLLLQDSSNIINNLESEVSLRHRMQISAASATAAAAARAAATAMAAAHQKELLDSENTSLTAQIAALNAEIELRQIQMRPVQADADKLNRLITLLQWPNGPRALTLVLPQARMVRKISKIRWLRMVLRPLIRLARGSSAQIVQKPPRTATIANASQVASSNEFPLARVNVEPPKERLVVSTTQMPAKKSRLAVHQFHPSVAYGDAVTNSMLLRRDILRKLGYWSEIYVVYVDPALANEVLLLAEMPTHDEYVLIVVHSLGYDDAPLIAAFPAPKILMYHNITPSHLLADVPELARLADLGRTQLDFWRPRVSAALADSEFNALELRQYGHMNATVCPLLFDIDKLQARANAARKRDPNDPFTVLFIGRILESKGQAQLVDAFGAFNLAYGHPCRLVLVGRSEGGGDQYVADLYQRIGEQGLRRCVILTGHVSDVKLSDWLGRADLYVSLSQHEGFGVPLIEAMSFDVPVLAYGAGAIPFTMQRSGASAQILYSRDAHTVAAAMLEIATDPTRQASIIAAQRENLERFALHYHIPTLQYALLSAGASPPNRRSFTDLTEGLTFTITGHFKSNYSLAAVNRALAEAMAQVAPGRVKIQPVEGEPISDLGFIPLSQRDLMQRLAKTDLPHYAPSVVISQHYPVHVPPPADLKIAYFFWEESFIPSKTVATLNENFDAVFSPSKFVSKALIDSGVSRPVRTIGYAPPLAQFEALACVRSDRTGRQNVTFLHVSSGFPRKGIDLLLAAYAKSFTSADPVRLIIKTFSNPHNETSVQVAKLRQLHELVAPIELIEQDLDETALLALFAQSDIAVLPSRGEGFNIPAAEAMAAALPLIVTGAGGHADFIKAEDAVLIPWTLQNSGSHLGSSQSLWLAPDVDALALAMREVFEDLVSGRREAAKRAAHARKSVAQNLDSTAWARRVTAATSNLMQLPLPGPRRIAVISSWNVRCGIAEYTRHMISGFFAMPEFDDSVLVLCDYRTAAASAEPRLRVCPAWKLGADDAAPSLAVMIAREDPHILIIEYHPGIMLWSSLAALLIDPRLTSRVLVVTLHSTLELLRIPDAEQDAVLAGLQICDRVIVHTVVDVNFLHRFGLSANVVLIPQGALPAQHWPALRKIYDDDAPVIGCYGFFLPPKGIDLLIAAIPAIRNSWPALRVKLVNADYGTEESSIEIAKSLALATSLGINDCIEWETDFLPHEKSMALLQDCDLIVLPYRPTLESSSAALRSCLTSGTPVIVTTNPIFDEASDAVMRVGADAPQYIADGVTHLLKDLLARETMRVAMRRWLEERCWNDLARRTHGMVIGLSQNNSTMRGNLTRGDRMEHPKQLIHNPLELS